MRYIVSLLVLINLGVFIYFNQDFFYQVPIAEARAEIDPDKMHLLTQHQLDALPKINTVSPVSTVAESQTNVVSVAEVMSCFEWGIFNNNNIADAQTTASKLLLSATLKEHNANEAKRYWVHLPKLKNAQEAQEKFNEIKLLGVEDLYILQDAKWKNAISFGIFEDEQLANKLLDDLKAKGIKNVTKTVRAQGGGNFSLLIKNASVSDFKNLKQAKAEFPEATIKEVACN